MSELTLQPIGYIRTGKQVKFQALHQPSEQQPEHNLLELLPDQNYEQALRDLAGFSRVWLVWWFHRNTTWRTQVIPPRGPAQSRGVFATRSPHRPNPIGLTPVQLIAIEGRTLILGECDLVDGTPVFDLKPYVPAYDSFPDERAGWIDAVDALCDTVEQRFGGVDILVNNAGRSIRRSLAESLDRWHDVERTMTLNYYSPLRLIRGLAPGMIERGDGHIINVATWGVLTEAPPLFGVYNASKAALSAVSRVIETEWARKGVHSTTLYYPLVATPMIAPTKAYDGVPALSPQEAGRWMIDAAVHRPVRIAPRFGMGARALDVVAPRALNRLLRQQRMQP
jgi:tRNA-Thr(GGU) m(6)t(6)A37 methyltransferase TsaA